MMVSKPAGRLPMTIKSLRQIRATTLAIVASTRARPMVAVNDSSVNQATRRSLTMQKLLGLGSHR